MPRIFKMNVLVIYIWWQNWRETWWIGQPGTQRWNLWRTYQLSFEFKTIWD